MHQHLHILGICGTFMGGLALLARELGLTVSGCDANVYPPMSDQLAAAGIADGENLASLRAAVRQDPAAAHGSLAGAESMPTLADQHTWLIGALHSSKLRFPENSKSGAVYKQVPGICQRARRPAEGESSRALHALVIGGK